MINLYTVCRIKKEKERKKMEKKIRGTYKIDDNKTPQENITEILKLMMPVKLTLNKLQEGTNSNSDVLNLSGVKIEAVGQYRWSTCKDIKDFRRIQFRVRIPGRNYGRQSSRNWSVPVKWIPKKNYSSSFCSPSQTPHEVQNQFENYDKKVSLTHIANVFDELSKLYGEGEVRDIKNRKLQEQAKIKLENLKKESGIPSEVSLRHTNYGDYCVDGVCEEKEPEYRYALSISLSQLTEEQVTKMGSLLNEISRIKNERFR